MSKLLLAEPILDQFRQTFQPTKQATLAIVLVGTHPASELFVGIKEQKSQDYGVKTRMFRFSETITTSDLVTEIKKLNDDTSINAAIVQLPLPESINTDQVLDSIAPSKDVDNLTGQNYFMSPMVQSVAALVDYYKLDISGKKLCVVGRGRLVGTPLTEWLIGQNITPTVVDESTPNRDEQIQLADVVFGGAGEKDVINDANTREGQIVFDCSGKDVDFERIKDKVTAITPSKGGIGPLTVHFLFMNTLNKRNPGLNDRG